MLRAEMSTTRTSKPETGSEETMVSLEFTRSELHVIWAGCFTLHEREQAALNGAANYETVRRQDAGDALDRLETVIRKLNPLLSGYLETELSTLLEH
jgi:hypothetical protein